MGRLTLKPLARLAVLRRDRSGPTKEFDHLPVSYAIPGIPTESPMTLLPLCRCRGFVHEAHLLPFPALEATNRRPQRAHKLEKHNSSRKKSPDNNSPSLRTE